MTPASIMRPGRALAPRKYEPHINRAGAMAGGLGSGSPGFWPKVKYDGCAAPGGCWLWIGYVSVDGAGKFCTKRRRLTVSCRAHHVAWRKLRGAPRNPRVWSLLSLCGHSDCVNPDHRRWVLRVRVVRTLHELGRHFEYADNRGEMSGRAILTEEDVLFIRAQPHAYGMAPLLGRLFGVSPITVHQVWYGRIWKHLGDRRGKKTEVMTTAQVRALVAARERDRADLAELRLSAPMARPGEAA